MPRIILVIILILIMFLPTSNIFFFSQRRKYNTKLNRIVDEIRIQTGKELNEDLDIQINTDLRTPNVGIRKPNFVVIHYTGQDSLIQSIRTFTNEHYEVSTHYLITKGGIIIQFANDYLRTNHAGLGKWGMVTDMNSCSIGIELENNGTEPYPDIQITKLITLLSNIKRKFNIPIANFIGHEDYAPSRKLDPGPLFPWKRLSYYGFGYWRDNKITHAPFNFSVSDALRVIGYDTKDMNSAIVAFKNHYIQLNQDPQLTRVDSDLVYNIYSKYNQI